MMVQLSTVELEKVIKIEKFVTAYHITRSLWEIGIIPDGLYRVKNKLSCGKIVIGNDNFKVALDKIIAEQILVRKV
jgi:Fe2+ transport system protein FeoA